MSAKNLVLIISDEHQARALSCAGHSFVKTPNLDSLARRGTRFTSAYTPCPICVPARASLATGRYVHKHRYWDNAIGWTRSRLGRSIAGVEGASRVYRQAALS